MNGVNIITLIPLGAFLLCLVLQTLLPRRPLLNSGLPRLVNNAALFVVNSLLLRFLIPLTLLSASIWAFENSIGVFNWLLLPPWLTILICVVLLDLSIYAQHVATHRFPLLWRLHKVHHADTDMDVTTAVRFHPIELTLSLIYKSLMVVLLGVPVTAVIVFELILFVGPAFNHSNMKIPLCVDRVLRFLIVTPDTHRAHHSTLIDEQNTNYGFFLIWWDKIFATYTADPKTEHQTMSIGLELSRDQCDRVDQMLMAPFR